MPSTSNGTFSLGRHLSSIAARIQGALGGGSPAAQVSRIVHPDALTYGYYIAALDVLTSWSRGSLFAGRVRLNQPLQPGSYNLYLVEHDYLVRSAPSLADNCSYWPGSWAIVCDTEFIGRMLRLLDRGGLDESPPPDNHIADTMDRIKEGIRAFLFEWLIAHEMGHIVLDHSERDLAKTWTYGGGVAVGQEIEKEADEFYISKLQHDDGRQCSAYLGLSSLVTALYREAVLAQHPKKEIERQIARHGPKFIYSTELEITQHYRTSRHPPMLLRALNLTEVLLARYPNLVDGSNYFSRIRSRIKLVSGDSRRLWPIARDEQPKAPVQLLARHAQILAAESAPRQWISSTFATVRGSSGTVVGDWQATSALRSDRGHLHNRHRGSTKEHYICPSGGSNVPAGAASGGQDRSPCRPGESGIADGLGCDTCCRQRM